MPKRNAIWSGPTNAEKKYASFTIPFTFTLSFSQFIYELPSKTMGFRRFWSSWGESQHCFWRLSYDCNRLTPPPSSIDFLLLELLSEYPELNPDKKSAIKDCQIRLSCSPNCRNYSFPISNELLNRDTWHRQSQPIPHSRDGRWAIGSWFA